MRNSSWNIGVARQLPTNGTAIFTMKTVIKASDDPMDMKERRYVAMGVSQFRRSQNWLPMTWTHHMTKDLQRGNIVNLEIWKKEDCQEESPEMYL
ncbi:hypothetical protein AMTR_s00007p00264040 [Amborella trichopoda]|uniref:Uncharacterized protein n=1 Tax=Amborella trichopoda TaxID=13333 RepID=W1PC53_AMBTC|nr:hypothetical protein AMTR_s00007p00264040 [Amborella trichopoda]